MKVKQIMTHYFGSLKTTDTLLIAAKLYLENHVVCAPVLQGDSVAGILTLYQLVSKLVSGLSLDATVEEIMETDISHLWVNEETPFADVQDLPLERLLVQNSAGQLTGILTRLELITAVHDALLEKSNELSTIVDCLHNGIIAVDLDGIVRMFNPAAERITGVPAGKALGRYLAVALPSKQEANLLDVLATGTSEFSASCVFNQTKAICNRTPIIKDGQITGAVSVLQDVSELEQILRELVAVKELYSELRSVIESSRDGIIIVDAAGTLIRANDSLWRIIRTGSDFPLEGVRLCDLPPMVTEAGRCNLDLWEVFQAVSVKRDAVTVSARCPGGIELLIMATPVLDDRGESIIRIVFDIRDMTELISLQNQLEKTRSEQTRVASEVEILRKKLLTFENYVYQSPEMLRVLELTIRVAQVDSTVLITGESGVGKEIIAKIIHKTSKRKGGPFIQINCGAIPENLLESELFGYEKGAFTGANRDGKLGILEIANNGTLLLDEVGELPFSLQVKLLRALQEQQIYRIGSVKPIQLNVRMIAATNKNLQEMVKNGLFREDLYYRLNVVPINIPSLRQRKMDILPLTLKFLDNCNQKYNLNKKISAEVFDQFESYEWPGNVRELENLVERLVVMSDEDLILPRHLPYYFGSTEPGDKMKLVLSGIIPLKEASELVEKELIQRALSKHGSTRKAARALGVTHATVLRKAHQYNISNYN